ncbi:hypothetical protein, partial [Thermoactinomyces vulgaris]
LIFKVRRFFFLSTASRRQEIIYHGHKQNATLFYKTIYSHNKQTKNPSSHAEKKGCKILGGITMDCPPV